jgi:aquaporin Z
MAAAYLPDASDRRALTGLAMGLTATFLILSPPGQRSGAHFNPAVTLTYWALGRISAADASLYVLFQFLGGLIGTGLAWVAFGDLLEHSAVNFAATLPGADGPAVARFAEFLISFLMMSVLLRVSNSRRFERATPYVAGLLVALFITFEAPLSGMSMNPARTLASALPAGQSWWPSIYFVAPPLGMLAAAALFALERGAMQVHCAKLNHRGPHTCIFHCNHGALYER